VPSFRRTTSLSECRSMAPYQSGLTCGLYAAWHTKLARESHSAVR
jgi:hypothetical protein